MSKDLSNTQRILYIIPLILVAQTAIDIYMPSLPHIVAALHTHASTVQSSIALYLLAFACSQLCYGPLADHYGRKPVAITGLSIFAIASLICANAHTVTILLIGRFIEGLGAGAPSVVSRALARDLFPAGKGMSKISSYMGMAWALTPILAPVLGSYIQHTVGWRGNFIFLASYAVIVACVIALLFEETLVKSTDSDSMLRKLLHNYRFLITSRFFLVHAFALMLLYSVFIVFNQAASFIFQEQFGVSTIDFGWCLFVVSFGYLVGTFINSRITQKHSVYTITKFGYLLYLVVAIKLVIGCYLYQAHVIDVVISMFFVTFALGFIYPNILAGTLSPFPKMAGSAGALNGSLLFIGTSIMSYLTAHYISHSLQDLAYALLFMSLAVGIIYYFIPYNNPNHD